MTVSNSRMFLTGMRSDTLEDCGTTVDGISKYVQKWDVFLPQFMSIQMGRIGLGGTEFSDRTICATSIDFDLAQVHLLLCMSRGRTGTGEQHFFGW